MHLNKRAFELDCLFIQGTPDLLLGLTPDVYYWARQRPTFTNLNAFSSESLNCEKGWFPIPFGGIITESILTIFSRIIHELLNAPAEVRGELPQLIQPKITSDRDSASVGGSISVELFDWAVDSLSEGKETSDVLRKNSSSVWNKLSEFPEPAKAEAFDCHSANGLIQLGRSGGNTGTTISVSGGRAVISSHNVGSHSMVMLVMAQLAMIEGEYRRTVE